MTWIDLLAEGVRATHPPAPFPPAGRGEAGGPLAARVLTMGVDLGVGLRSQGPLSSGLRITHPQRTHEGGRPWNCMPGLICTATTAC